MATCSGIGVIMGTPFLVALDLSDQLAHSGCGVIGPAASVKQALDEIDGVALDGVVLDVNLAGERSFPIAELLAARGIPFLFLTGYDSSTVFPEQFQSALRLSKPVDGKALTEAVAGFRRAACGPPKTYHRVREIGPKWVRYGNQLPATT